MFKEAFLQKGWAGKTISREETAARINPLLKRHHVLNHHYRYAIAHSTEADVVAAIERQQKIARMDAGKLAETVFSAGGTAYNGTALEPGTFPLPDGNDAMLFALRDLEQDFLDALNAENDIEHHMRTRAILGVVRTHSQERLTFLKDQTRRRRKPIR